MIMICQICNEAIGEVSLEGVSTSVPGQQRMVTHTIAPLRYPFSGAMVGSPDPVHEVPAPFEASLDWEAARCPYGRTHRAMVEEDLVKTTKGMVRLPRDGGPAFLDGSVTGDIDRATISSNSIRVPDEDANAQAREILQGGPKVVVSDEVPTDTVLFVKDIGIGKEDPFLDEPLIVESKEPIPPLHLYEVKHDPDVSGFICVQCSKKFETERQLNGHIGAVHSNKKPAKKKRRK